MIIGEGKPIKEILAMIEDHSKIILAGCRGCVTVCSAGGEKEVGILSAAVSLARENEGKPLDIKEVSLERQCDPEYLEEIRSMVDDYEGILSIACGAGVQFLAETYRKTPIYPGINTNFIGVTQEQGVWTERCQSCGDCKLHLTGGICPITRCAKSLLNGPCGGSATGKCEVNPETDCGWQMIYDRFKELGCLDLMEVIIPINDWTTSRDGGPRKIIREDLKL
ncbi:MAG: methylenetetrahydrofolate reductase C-terminal domain-containing protein [Thermodesulfobacteriota bacterium]|nr:methylenetetrahydrofolate reductase C-terminal domain-containing protein [Thermodesulfobacteriota bacterium]